MKPFRMADPIRTFRWREDRFHAFVFQHSAKCREKLGVTVKENVSFAKEKPLFHIIQIPGNLLHPCGIRIIFQNLCERVPVKDSVPEFPISTILKGRGITE